MAGGCFTGRRVQVIVPVLCSSLQGLQHHSVFPSGQPETRVNIALLLPVLAIRKIGLIVGEKYVSQSWFNDGKSQKVYYDKDSKFRSSVLTD